MDIFNNCPYCGRENGNHRPGCPNETDMKNPVCFCAICDGAIYEGETIYRMDGVPYHIGCFDDEYECTA